MIWFGIVHTSLVVWLSPTLYSVIAYYDFSMKLVVFGVISCVKQGWTELCKAVN